MPPIEPTPDPPVPKDHETTADSRLQELRIRISEVDGHLIRLMGERRTLALEVGRIKEERGLPVMDPAREARVVRQVAERAREAGVDEEMARDVIWRIIASAREVQEGRKAGWPDKGPGGPGSSPG